MTDIYDQYGCYLGTQYENKIVGLLAAHGHADWAKSIEADSATYLETVSEAGRYWMHCPFTRERLEEINKSIREAYEHATDRYEDWASD